MQTTDGCDYQLFTDGQNKMYCTALSSLHSSINPINGNTPS